MSLSLLSKNEKGSSSVLVIMVLLMLVTFGVLALITANSNLKVAEKNASWNRSYYQLENLGVQTLKKIQENADKLIMEIPAEWQSKIAELHDEIDYMDEDTIVIWIVSQENRRFFIELSYDKAESMSLQSFQYDIKQWREVPFAFEYEDELQFSDPGGN